MFKNIWIGLFLINTMLCFGQNKTTWEIDHKIKPLSKVSNAQTIFNEKNGHQYVLLRESRLTSLYVLNTNKKLVSNYEFNSQEFNKVNLEGVIFADNSMKIYSRLKKEIFRYSIDLNTGNLKYENIHFKSKKELHIKTINFKNKVYVVNCLKKENVLRVYSYDLNNKVEFFDFPFQNKLNIDSKKIKNLLKESKGDIKANLPVDITTTQYPTKIYRNDNVLSISFDSDQVTSTFQFNFDDKTGSFYSNPLNETRSSFAKYNSFLIDDNIIQSYGNSEGIDIYIKDFKTNKLEKTLHINRDEEIAFKNSEIVQIKGEDDKRILKNTNQLIRKSTYGKAKLSISAYHSNGNIRMDIGGVSDITKSNYAGAAFGVVGGGFAGTTNVPMGGGFSFGVYYNPISLMYYDYLNSKVTSVKCLFDKNYNSIEGEVPDNVFDRIKKDEENLENFEGKSISTFGNSVIVGHYFYKEEKYKFKTYSK